VEFLPCIINNELLIEEGAHHEGELLNIKENLTNEATNMYQAQDVVSSLVEELEATNLKLKVSMKLMKIDRMLEKISLYNEGKNYEKINHVLNNIQLIIDDPEERVIRSLDMYENLKMRLSYERASMLENLVIRFENLIQMKEKSFLKTRSINMNIAKDSEKLLECTNALVASDFDFKDIVSFFMSMIFEPIITRAVSLEVKETDQDYTMNLSYSTEAVADPLRPGYVVVFNNLKTILNYLSKMNVQLNTGEFFLARIMENYRQEFLESIYKNCLIHSIPKTFEDKNQCTMSADITKLSELFAQLNFLPEGGETLDDYSQKVNELFYDQFTKNIQASASELLKRDLHDMILISEDTTISTNTPLTFPRSMVSKSTLELVRMLEKIIKEAQSSENDKDKQKSLVNSIKSVLENFTFTVQIHHSKFMSKIPQQSALFYNNCMYLSNWVSATRETENCVGMEEVIGDLEKQGWEVLELQIAKQQIQLLEILREFGKF
jgi:protein transport protein DSL1/ZW10